MFDSARVHPSGEWWRAMQVLSSPAAASACVCVTHTLLNDAAFFADAVCLAALPHLLLLLLRAADAQPVLRPRVMRIVGDALRAVDTGRAEHAKGLLHLYLHLLMRGRVEVLEHARRWAADADVSLVRYFVLQARLLCRDLLQRAPARQWVAVTWSQLSNVVISLHVPCLKWARCEAPNDGLLAC